MKEIKRIILILGLLSLIALIAVGCGSNQPASTGGDAAKTPAETQPPAETDKAAPVAEAAAYVGDDACKSCHSKVSTGFHATKHSEALTPISDYQLAGELPKAVDLFDGADPENTKPVQVDLSTAKLYGVMVNEYLLAEVPGFKNKIYRVAKLVKNGDKYDLEAAKSVDVDKDGKNDWQAADATRCAKCHAPGFVASSPTLGISCESCHGPGSKHVAAGPDEKKGAFGALPNTETCLACHETNPAKDDKGTIIAANHYGARNWFASKHAQSGQLNGCMACHSPHQANAKGQLVAKDNAADVCATCHAGAKFDPDKLMWKNPTDPHNHITADHSFGALKYDDMGDDSATPDIEVTNPAYVELIKGAFPELAK